MEWMLWDIGLLTKRGTPYIMRFTLSIATALYIQVCIFFAKGDRINSFNSKCVYITCLTFVCMNKFCCSDKVIPSALLFTGVCNDYG
jgi:hypothetical protein